MEAIYAIDLNYGLSKDEIIPWKSKKDMEFFYEKTKKNIVIMGRNTYLSLPDNVRPLKNRLNIVLTSNPTKYPFLHNNSNKNVVFTDNDNICNTLLNKRKNMIELYPYLDSKYKIFIIGGKQIYEKFIPLCNIVWVTQIKKDYLCDLIFKYDYSSEFKEPIIIEEDDELIIFKYEKFFIL